MYEVAHARSQRLHIPIVTWLYWIGVHIPALLLEFILIDYLDQIHDEGSESFLLGLITSFTLIGIASMSYGQAWILKRTIDPNLFKQWFGATLGAACVIHIASYMLNIDYLLFMMFRNLSTRSPIDPWLSWKLTSIAITCLIISGIQAWILRKAGYRMLHWVPVMLISWIATSLTIAWFSSSSYESHAGSTVLVMGGASLLNGVGLFLIQPTRINLNEPQSP